MKWWMIGLILILGIAVAIYFYFREQPKRNAENILQEVMPVWATFAPFKDGLESATTLYHCFWALKGKEQADSLKEQNLYEDHIRNFDADPRSWDDVIETARNVQVENIEEKRRRVLGLLELSRLEKEGNLPDWMQYYALGHMLTSTENKAAVQLYEYLHRLLKSNQEIELQANELSEVYVLYTNHEIDKKMSAGLLLYASLLWANDNPNTDISREIISLKDKMFEQHQVSEE